MAINLKGTVLDYGQDFKYKIVISVLSAIVIVFAFVFVWNSVSSYYSGMPPATPTCGDGSFYNTCNLNKPYYCDGETGMLVEKASLCGCPLGMTKNADTCVSPYQTKPKEITFNYTLRGEQKQINAIVYGGMTDYISNLSKVISYSNGETPLRSDFKLRNLNDVNQRQLLLPLLIEIENSAKDRNDQIRIAVSLVQNIPFGESNKTSLLLGGITTNYSRYPYDVLYDGMGICGEKSELLAFFLKEMGYGVVFFYNQAENHESLGVKCPARYSHYGTGYCFIETTGPAIISDSKIEFVGGIKLQSEPEIILVSNGEGIGDDFYEYKDAKTLERLRGSSVALFKKARLNALEEKYGLVENYYIG